MARLAAASVLAIAASALAACSFSPTHETTVSEELLRNRITEKVSEQSGTAPDSVACPGDLLAVVGTTLDCTMTRDGKPYRMNVTVRRVDGDRVSFDIAQTVGKDAVAKQIAAQLTERVGRTPKSVSCPSDLRGHEGETLRCELDDHGEIYGVTVNVTSVRGGVVKFDFKVDDAPR